MNMKFFILMALVAVAISIPTPPTTAQAYTTNYTLTFPDYVGDTYARFLGAVAVDLTTNAAYIELGGEEFLPLSIHTNFVAQPSSDGSTISTYMFEGPLCWKYPSIPSFISEFFPLQVPPTAQFNGTSVIDGVKVTGWTFDYLSAYDVLAWVSVVDNSIVKMVYDTVPYVKHFEVDFKNTVIGTPSPSWFQVPNEASCKSSWTSSPVKRMLRAMF
ncbi:hypothetical protein PROFUN_01108 [Planoprotostelium fungivorum]|uniref:Uncharacterized protein n=1 Tax=Planoprotostelium fungivorum TaxID=1890364 RepID=A0A2P6NCA8_9EUKA|nr:hypothetical protein PROFUN_01108 [Planoprotostelium fungivorum]